jgi:hypothetical protein
MLQGRNTRSKDTATTRIFEIAIEHEHGPAAATPGYASAPAASPYRGLAIRGS